MKTIHSKETQQVMSLAKSQKRIFDLRDAYTREYEETNEFIKFHNLGDPYSFDDFLLTKIATLQIQLDELSKQIDAINN